VFKGVSLMGSLYLIAGGAPAGIILRTGDEGFRTNSTKMNTTTIQGNRRTTPRGTEMLELPFNRKGRRKNASLDMNLLFGRDSSFKGRVGGGGRRFSALLTRSIDTKPG
jgi:hypothetical protein